MKAYPHKCSWNIHHSAGRGFDYSLWRIMQAKGLSYQVYVRKAVMFINASVLLSRR